MQYKPTKSENSRRFLQELKQGRESSPAVTEWLRKVVGGWCAPEVTPQTPAVSFVLGLSDRLIRSQDRFDSLNCDDFFITLVQVAKARVSDLEYLELLSSFLEHQSGIEWMMAHSVWEDVLQMSNRRASTLLFKLVQTSVQWDDRFAAGVLDACSEAILDHLLVAILNGEDDPRVVLLFLKHLKTAASGKIGFAVQFLELYAETATPQVEDIKNRYVSHLFQNSFEDVIEFCHFGQLYWCLVDSKLAHPETSRHLPFSNQLLILQLMPNFCLIKKYLFSKDTVRELNSDDFRDTFFCKLTKMMSESMMRACYFWRGEFAMADLCRLSSLSLSRIRESRKYFSRDRAVVVFQTLVYNSKDFIYLLKGAPEKFEESSEELTYFAQVFAMLVHLIEEFGITWRDSLEAVDVMALSFDFLTVARCPSDLVVQALELIRVAIVKYLTPAMALLVDSTANSTVGLLGPVLREKLFHEVGEARKGDLRVVGALSSMAAHHDNMENVIRCELKIDILLKYFIERKHQNKFDVHLEKFVNFLRKQEARDLEYALVTLPDFTEWLKTAVHAWSASGVTSQTSIVSFALTVAGLLSKNEETFCHLNQDDFFTKLIKVYKAREPKQSLEYVKLLMSFLEHKSGIEWTIAHNFWEDVLEMCWSESVVDKSTEFMSLLLERTVKYSEKFANEVIKRVLAPLDPVLFNSVVGSTGASIADATLSVFLKRAFGLVAHVVEYFLDCLFFGRGDLKLVLLILTNFFIEEKMSELMTVVQKDISFEMDKIIFMMHFIQLYVKVGARRVTEAEVASTVRRLKSDYIAKLTKGNYETVLKFCNFGQLYWRLVDSKVHRIETAKRKLCFTTELVFVQLYANLMNLVKFFSSRIEIEHVQSREYRETFLDIMLSKTSQEITRVRFFWRRPLLESVDNLFKFSSISLDFVKKSRKYYTRDAAVIVFHVLIYNLKDLNHLISQYPEKRVDRFIHDYSYFSQVVELLTLLIEDFDIALSDNFEAIDITMICFEFLSLPSLSAGFVQQVLKLTNVAIVKHLAPNIALLIDSTTDLAIGLMGPLLHAKLSDEVWGVKEAALGVVATMAHLSGDIFKHSVMENVVRCKVKIDLLLENFLAKSQQKQLDVSLKKFVKFLRKQEARDLEYPLVALPAFPEWLKTAVRTWSASGVTSQTCVVSFSVAVASLLSKNEAKFRLLNKNNFFDNLIDVCKAPNLKHSVSVQYINLVKSFLEHKSGVEWTICRSSWKDIVEMSLSSHDEHITEKSTEFVPFLLERTARYDDSFSSVVIKRVLAPLDPRIFSSVGNSGRLADARLLLYIKRVLTLVGSTVEYFLERLLFDQKDLKFVLLILTNFFVEEKMSQLMNVAQKHDISFEMSKIVFMMHFIELYIKVGAKRIDPPELASSVKTIKNQFISRLYKGNYESLLKFCNFGQLYWRLVDSKLQRMESPNAKYFPFTTELLFLQLYPNLLVVMKYFGSSEEIEDILSREYRTTFVKKFLTMTSQEMTRLRLFWRYPLLENLENLFRLSSQCLILVKKSRKYLTRDAAVAVFHVLIYNLKDLNHLITKYPEKRMDRFLHDYVYFSQVFELLALLVDDFDITLDDNFEAIDITMICFEFLSLSSLSPAFVEQALKLTNVAIVKHLAPNVALLIDSTTDLAIGLMGPLLYAKLNDRVWEVRKAGLEVVSTMAHLSGGNDSLVSSRVPLRTMEGAIRCELKIDILLEYFIIKKQKNTLDGHLQKFVDFLRKQEARDLEYPLVALPAFTDFLKNAVHIWSASGVTSQTSIISFALTVASLLSKNEEKFRDLNNDDFFTKLIKVCKAPNVTTKLEYINLLLSILEHKSGIDWMIAHSFWEDVLKMCYEEQVNAKATEFLSLLLERTVKYDEKFTSNVIKRVLAPLDPAVFSSVVSSGATSLAHANRYLKRVTGLVANLLEYFLNCLFLDQKDLKTVLVILTNFFVEDKTSELVIDDFEMHQIVFMMRFVELYIKVGAKRITDAELASSVRTIKADFISKLYKGDYGSVLKFCNFGQLYWRLVESKFRQVEAPKRKESFPFRTELLVLQLYPSFILLTRYFSSRDEIDEVFSRDYRETFHDDIVKMTSQEVMRMIYFWRTPLFASVDNNYRLCSLFLDFVKKSRKCYTRDEAVMIFNALIYNLKDLNYLITKYPEKRLERSLYDYPYFTEVFELLVLLIEDFDIALSDNFEVIDITMICFEFLALPSLSSAFVEQALKLTNTAIVKHLAPNVALLIDSTADLAIGLMGPLLSTKSKDEVREVRKAALEVVATMTNVSGGSKFI